MQNEQRSTPECFRCAQFQQGRTVNALTPKDEEGRRRVRNASASSQTSFDPGMSEWGNPPAQRASA